MRAALVGCGDVSRRYAAAIAAADGLELAAVTDLDAERAGALASELGVAHAPSLEALLADDGVELVVNLTAPRAHAAVTRAALEAGKHVHTEKPLALGYEEARELAELATARGVRLSAAPATLLGEAQQTAWKLVRDGEIGRVRLAYAEANWGRIESWHPDPAGLYAVGPLVDVGVYALTVLTAMLGPARRVHAYAATLQPERTTKHGVTFSPEAPDLTIAVVEHEGGAVSRTTASFYAGTGAHRGIELHGDEGRLFLASWAEADSRLLRSDAAGEYQPLPLLREPFHGIDWGRPLVDLGAALEERRPHRAGAEHAAHVVEIVEAAARSATAAAPVDLRSSFTAPQPMEWAR